MTSNFGRLTRSRSSSSAVDSVMLSVLSAGMEARPVRTSDATLKHEVKHTRGQRAAWGQTWQRHAGFAPEQILLQVHSVNTAQGGQVARKSLQFVAT